MDLRLSRMKCMLFVLLRAFEFLPVPGKEIGYKSAYVHFRLLGVEKSANGRVGSCRGLM